MSEDEGVKITEIRTAAAFQIDGAYDVVLMVPGVIQIVRVVAALNQRIRQDGVRNRDPAKDVGVYCLQGGDVHGTECFDAGR